MGGSTSAGFHPEGKVCRSAADETSGLPSVNRRAQFPISPAKGRHVTHAYSPMPAAIATGPPEPDLVRIRDVVYQAAGIFHPDNKLRLLHERCNRRMKELNVQTLREYLKCLTISPSRQAELVALLDEITIGETCFFRNPMQLDALRRIVIPAILRIKSKQPSRSFRIWSAGCSTGEEPYTVRMVLLEEAGEQMHDWSVGIMATDINQRSLLHARQGVYGQRSTRNVPPAYQTKYFVAHGEECEVGARARTNVNFSRVNLSDDAGMTLMESVDVIFCCNVLIYFDLVSKQRVIRHFFDILLPHGYLFLGNSESLYGVSADFRLVHLPGTTAYVKGERSPSGGEGI